jgi:hypothetical protein
MLEEDDYDELMQEVAKGQEAEKPPSPGLALSPPPHPGRQGRRPLQWVENNTLLG